MDNFKILLNSSFCPKNKDIACIPSPAWMMACVCENQNKAILTANAAVNFGLTDVAKVYNLNDDCLIYEIAA